MGYHRAGFRVIGIDLAPQPHYPFEFIQGDAFSIPVDLVRKAAAIHASPPCQRYSDLQKRSGMEYPDLIGVTREFCERWALPYVIENVDTAPLIDPIMLCGAMFGLRVYRHRKFESNVDLIAPHHPKHVAKVWTLDKRKAHYGQPLTKDHFVQVTGGGNAPQAVKLEAMGIDWKMTRKEVNEAIPPAYTEWIGNQL